ncbi:MAG: MerR family transcriptional regulator [Promethearchaeota archaeon]
MVDYKDKITNDLISNKQVRCYLNIKKAAELLNVCVKTIRRWDAAGKIICYRTQGGHRRIPMSEVVRLRSHKGKPPAQSRDHMQEGVMNRIQKAPPPEKDGLEPMKVYDKSIKFLKKIINGNNIYKLTAIPRIKKLTITFATEQDLYSFSGKDLIAHLNLKYRKSADKLHAIIKDSKGNKSKKEAKKEKRIRKLFNNYDRTPPTLKLEGRKIINCQTFYTNSNSRQKSCEFAKNSEPSDKVMGVDIGLRTPSSLSILSSGPPKEEARFSLGHDVLFNSRFNPSTG